MGCFEDGYTSVAVARLNPDGLLDTTFGDGGFAATDSLLDPSVPAVVVAPNGNGDGDVAENDHGYDGGSGDPPYQTYAPRPRGR